MLIGLGVLGALLIIFVPLAVIFVQAFSAGWAVYLSNISHPETLHAIYLTLLTAAVAVPLSTGFGIAAAWLVTRFDFPGKRLLSAFIDIPFSVSPVVAGVMYLMLYGSRGWVGGWLEEHDIQLMFNAAGIILVITFITSPFVARELIPFMEAQGSDEEEAAISLGASGWQTFWRVTLPNIKWALIYGVILCNARAMGEFGAVSVVSGNIRGETNTLPLHVELLYQDYNAAGAFAAASLLALIAILTLILKTLAEWRQRRAA
ncbi:MAG TPA: sulfate ABC transporter permease subunit CysW [Gammaproteobacteria bacterium]|nr:sulfate ABC transporter permease subunit CysW [Gammaproteobacteria bacterium]